MSDSSINTAQLPILALPMGNLEAYIAQVNAIPMLTQEEEYELADRLQQDGDLEAAQRLILAHLKYVVRVAKGYMGYGLPLADLVQEGSVGLMKAVKRFDPDVGVRLVSFAVHWIKAEIHEYVLKNWRIVKVATTKAQRKLFFNLRSAKKRLGWMSNEEVSAVAEDLGVTTKDVLEMERRLNSQDMSFELPSDHDEAKALPAPAQYLEDDAADPEQQLLALDWDKHTQQTFSRIWQELDPRSQEILAARYLSEKKATFKELAAKFNISIERVRQLEKQAIEKLKELTHAE